MAKTLCDEIKIPLTAITNTIIDSSTFPNKLKTAKVRPIFKGDDQDEVGNYHAISVLPVFSKSIEKII